MIVFLLLCSVDLYLAHRFLPHYEFAKSFEPYETIRLKIQSSSYRERIYTKPWEMVKRTEDIFKYYRSQYRLMIPNIASLFGYYDANEKDVLSLKPNHDIRQVVEYGPDDLKAALLTMMSVKYFLTYEPLQSRSWEQILYLEKINLRLYRNRSAPVNPRVVSKGIVVDSMDYMRGLMMDTSFIESDQVVVYEPAIRGIPLKGIPKTGTEIQEFRFQSYEPLCVTLSGTMKTGGFLVLADSFYPDWQVYSNNKRGTVFRGNYLFRAIPLGPGYHRIEMIYYPYSFMFGMYISCFTLLILIFFIVSMRIN
jgi:hypothetical protein